MGAPTSSVHRSRIASSGAGRPIRCLTISSSMIEPASRVGRLRGRAGSRFGMRRSEAIRSSASLLNGWGGSDMVVLVEAAVADEDVESVRHGAVKSGVAVQKAPAQDVAAEEPPGRAKNRGPERKTAPLGPLLLQKKVGEGIEFRDVA